MLSFPLEFAALKPALSAFVATLFEENPFQFKPVFRGFYFTSGTQEGRPLDRVLGRLLPEASELASVLTAMRGSVRAAVARPSAAMLLTCMPRPDHR